MTIVVYGAGGIGCYVGGRLLASGVAVRFVGRERVGRELAEYGLRVTDYLGADLHVPASRIDYGTTPAAAADAELVLVTVKSAATEAAGRELAGVLKPGAVVVSFQNGIRNGDVLRAQLNEQTVLTGMVPFNVLNRGQGVFHQGTAGLLDVERHAAIEPYLEDFDRAGLPLTQHDDILSVQWAKLLLNLNNPINALSDLPLRDELSQRAYRRCLAMAQEEAIGLLDAAGITPAKILPLPMRRFPTVLRLPDVLFRRLAGKMLAIDPHARTSMWEDLQAGRPTEIDFLNGAVVRLADQLSRSAPVNNRLVELLRAAEAGPRKPWTGPALLAELTDASSSR